MWATTLPWLPPEKRVGDEGDGGDHAAGPLGQLRCPAGFRATMLR